MLEGVPSLVVFVLRQAGKEKKRKEINRNEKKRKEQKKRKKQKKHLYISLLFLFWFIIILKKKKRRRSNNLFRSECRKIEMFGNSTSRQGGPRIIYFLSLISCIPFYLSLVPSCRTISSRFILNNRQHDLDIYFDSRNIFKTSECNPSWTDRKLYVLSSFFLSSFSLILIPSFFFLNCSTIVNV